jgi:hypothetical protein
MRLTDTSAHAALDAMLPAGASNGRLSLHSAYSATGANLVGVTTACTFAAAAGRTKALSAAVDIAVPGAATVRWIGAWDSTGVTFKGMIPNGGSARSFQLDLTNNRIYCEGSGFVNDDKVAFFGDTVPGGLTEGTEYFVVGVTAGDPDYFQVSATSGGAAIDITSQHGAGCDVSKLVPEVYAAAGTHRVNSFNLVM